MAKAAKKPLAKKPSAGKNATKAKPLTTIGYEQAVQSRVIDELTRAKVDILVDVRAVAASRKPGFSKNQLAAGLDDKGIAYLHFQKLGTPKEGREAARAGHMDKLFRIYSRHLKTKGAQQEMDELTDLRKSGKRICLLCFERNPDACHRQWIAEEIEARTGAKVKHLAADLL
jgi:uncharacterized protein (DUF488 family)